MKKVFWLLTVSVASWAATYTVCVKGGCPTVNNYAAINDAIKAATCGDTILIMAGKGGGDGMTHAPGNPPAPAGAHCGGDNLCSANNPIWLKYKSCTGAITVVTDQSFKLPPEGSRILPSYIDGASPVLPTVFNPAYGAILLTDEGGAVHTPGHDYILRGLSFAPGSYGYGVFVGVGDIGADFPDPNVLGLQDLPQNIAFDQVVARITPTPPVASRRVFSFNQNGGSLTNSWVQGAADGFATDHQAVLGACGQNIKLLNNYMEAPSEVVFTAGMCPAYSPRPGDVWAASSGVRDTNWELAWSHVTHPAWNLMEVWQPNTSYPLGKLIIPTSGVPNGMYGYLATVEGTTGSTEPPWPTPGGTTVVDGAITWLGYDFSNFHYTPNIKNFIETKQIDGFHIHHNFFEKNPGNQGDQDYGFTFAASVGASGQWTTARGITLENNWVENSGTAMMVRGADLDSPNAAASAYAANAGPWNMSAGNNKLALAIGTQATVIALPTGTTVTGDQVASAINAALGGKMGMACISGSSIIIRVSPDQSQNNCSGAQSSVVWTNYLTIVPTANDAAATLGLPQEGVAIYPCMNPITRQYNGCAQQDSLIVQNNLFKNLNSPQYPANNRNWVLSWSSNGVQGALLSHNTFDVRYGDPIGRMILAMGAAPGALQTLGNNAWWPGSGLQIRDNVFSFRQDVTRYYDSDGDLAGGRFDFVAINANMCNVPWAGPQNPAKLSGALCPAGAFSHNVIPGAPLAAATTMNTDSVTDTAPFGQPYNSYPSDNFNDTYSSLTFDAQLRLTKPSLQGAGTDSKTPGVDPSQLPAILAPVVTTSDRAAVVSYTPSSPTAHSGYYCAARVTTQDPQKHFVPGVPADMDPSLYPWPESDANDAYLWDTQSTQRTMIIGLRASLSASTTYWLDLECPGASWSTAFATAAPLTGTIDLLFSRTLAAPGAMTGRIQYGYTYSRSVDAIGTPLLATTGNCRSCSITLPGVTAGRPLYMRWQELDGNGHVLASLPVQVAIPTSPSGQTSGSGGLPSAVSVTPGSGGGSSQTFSFVYSDPSGYSAISYAEVLINSGNTPANGCQIQYRAPNAVYLANDAGTAWLGPVNVRTISALQNSQCSINPASSSVSGSGKNLTLNLAVSFKPAFAGAKNIYLQANDANGGSGWQQLGSWIVP